MIFQKYKVVSYGIPARSWLKVCLLISLERSVMMEVMLEIKPKRPKIFFYKNHIASIPKNIDILVVISPNGCVHSRLSVNILLSFGGIYNPVRMRK